MPPILLTDEKNYNKCSASKQAAFYNKKYIQGACLPVLKDSKNLKNDLLLINKSKNVAIQETDKEEEIKTPLGTLLPFIPQYGGQEFTIVAKTSPERAFVSKILKFDDASKALLFLEKHLTDPNSQIEIIAHNFTYYFAAQRVIGLAHNLSNLYNLYTNSQNKNYFSPFALETFFKKETDLAEIEGINIAAILV